MGQALTLGVILLPPPRKPISGNSQLQDERRQGKRKSPLRSRFSPRRISTSSIATRRQANMPGGRRKPTLWNASLSTRDAKEEFAVKVNIGPDGENQWLLDLQVAQLPLHSTLWVAHPPTM